MVEQWASYEAFEIYIPAAVRLWSLHPKYLDPAGLTACWREALLARKVLCGETKGYRHHPQLFRFRENPDPIALIDRYLLAIYLEGAARGYRYDRSKIGPVSGTDLVPVNRGHVENEWNHLLRKLAVRSPGWLEKWQTVSFSDCHPIFEIRKGGAEPWEKSIPDYSTFARRINNG